jgi:cation:H+ antiporter
MEPAAEGVLWLLSLGIALAASEKLVHSVSTLGHHWHLSPALVGLLVAAGADGPEVTSALVAMSQGSSAIGLGVVLGSNIFNLAALLGLSAVLAHRVGIGPRRLTADAATNIAITALIAGIVLAPALHVSLAVTTLAIFALYAWDLTARRGRLRSLLPLRAGPQRDYWHEHRPPQTPPRESAAVAIAGAAVSIVCIVVASDILVRDTIDLASKLGLSAGIVGTIILAVATSLPNAWAAISLARRHMASAAIASAFNSNSINAVFGVALPSLFITMQVSTATRALDIWWLCGMTACAIGLLAWRRSLGNADGMFLVGLYCVFLAVRLLLF